MSSQISSLKVKKVSQLLDLPPNISDKDALIMIATLTDNYKISINYLLSGVKNTINSNAKIALSNLIDLSKNISITSDSDILNVTDNSVINSNGLRYPSYNISLSESKISEYGDIINSDGVITGNELQKFINKVDLNNAKIENDIFEINDKIKNLETSDNIEHINEKIEKIESDIYNIENNANVISNNVSNLENDVRSVKSDISFIESNVSNLENNITYVNTNISTINSDISNIKNNVKKINTNISSINSNISNLENKIDNLDISSYTTAISSDNENIIINYTNNPINKEISYMISLKTSMNNEDGLITKSEVIGLIEDIDTNLSWEIK